MGVVNRHAVGRSRFPVGGVFTFVVTTLLEAATFAAGERVPAFAPVDAPQFVCRSWTSEDGLPQNSVNALLQTRDGYLWVGTFGGLARFDGVKFTVFNVGNSEGLASNRILALAEDRRGVLWIGTEDGGVSRYVDGEFTALTERDGLPSNVVWALAEDHLGRIWISTNRGLVQNDRGRLTVFSTADGLPSPWAVSLLCDRRGRVWIGTDEGLACFEDEEIRAYTVDDGLPHSAIWSLMEDRSGKIWIGTRDGPALYSGDQIRAVTDIKGVIWSMTEDVHGDVWIGVEGQEFVRWSQSAGSPACRAEIEVVGPGSEVHTPIPVPRSLIEDREGNSWVGTRGEGLVRLRRARVHVLGSHNGCPTGVGPIVSDGEDGVWFGSAKPGVARWRRGGVSDLRIDGHRLLDTNVTYTLHRDGSGRLWISHGMQVSVVEEGRATVYTPEDGLGWGHKHAIHSDREGRVWIGTTESLILLDDGAFTAFTTQDGLGDDDVYCITQDRDGALWIGTFGGLSRLKDGEFTNFTHADGLSRGTVRSLYEDAEGVLWIGTYGGGLSRLKDGRFSRFTSDDGLFDDAVSCILEDDQGNLWMNGNRGVFAVPRRMLNGYADGLIGRIECLSLGADEGVSEGTGGAQAAGCGTPDGRLWFPNIDGMVVVDPQVITRHVAAPPSEIERILVDAREVKGYRALDLPPGVGDLEFHYTALTFRSPTKTRFKYRLDGYDEDWVFAGARRAAFYTRVPPGRYVFQVKAAHEAGPWSPTAASVPLSLAPHVYQTLWFRVTAIATISLLTIVVATRRIRTLRARVTALRREISSRERAERERARLEEQLRHAQKMEAVGTLSAGIAHDFNNLITAIQGYGESAKSLSGDDRRLAQAINGITQAAGQAAEVTRSLLTFSRSKPARKVPVDLIAIVAQSVTMLRPMLRSTIELATDPPGAEPLWIEADETQIQQVIMNLALNARDAMPDGGVLKLSVRHRSARELEPGAAIDGSDSGWASLIVEDNGIGMPEDVRKRVFDPFFSTKPRGQGTGLGMAVVHGIVSAHHGRIRLESTVGEGTRVTADFPCCPAPSSQPSKRTAVQAARRGRGELIVVAEEDERVRSVVAGALQAGGYRVIQVSDGAQALDAFAAHQGSIRAAIVDLDLPQISGEECIQRVREIHTELPVIAIGGLGEVDAEQHSLHDVTFLRKPFALSELTACVENELQRHPVCGRDVRAPKQSSADA